MNEKKNGAIAFQIFSLFALPILVMLSFAFLVCGALTPLAGIVQLLASVFHWDIPFMEYVKASVGTAHFGAVGSLLIFFLLGIVLLLLGFFCWKLLRFYIKRMRN